MACPRRCWQRAGAKNSAARRGRWAAHNVAERDAALGQVIGREFERDTVTRDDADVVFAHFPGGVGNDLVTILHAKAQISLKQASAA